MEFFSSGKPRLIGPVMKSTVMKIMKSPVTTNNTVSDKVMKYASSFYTNYLYENMFIIIIFLLVTIFLICRYRWKKEKDKEMNNKRRDEPFIVSSDDMVNYSTNYVPSPIKSEETDLDHQITMNPLSPITRSRQEHVINYLPNQITVNVPNGQKQIEQERNLYEDLTRYYDIKKRSEEYDHNDVNSHPSRTRYHGTNNTYSDVDPFDWSNRFNIPTGDFVSEMTQKNSQNLVDYQEIIKNMNANLSTPLTTTSR